MTVVRTIAVFLALAWLTAPAAAQSRRPRGEEWSQVRPLFPLVQAVASGAPAPTDVGVAWQCHFVDADAGVTLVPFTLELTRGTFTSFPVAMYVRVVLRGAPAPAPGPTDALAQYPFEDAAIVEGPINGRISRAFTAPPGDYDVYVALTEHSADPAVPPKTAVVKQAVTVPDLKSRFTTSSVIVTESVEPNAGGERASYEEQLDDPYRLWGNRITPSLRRTFRQAEALSVLFLVYQAQGDSGGKPDVEVSYTVRGAQAGTELVVRVPSERFTAESLPSAFDLTKGDLILAGRQIPLRSFSPGSYRLEILVTDHRASASVRRVVPFSVEP